MDKNYNNKIEVDINKIKKNQEESCSASWIFERYVNIISKKNQKFSIITNDIKDVLVPFDDKNIKDYHDNDFIQVYKSASFLFQNLISNLIREKILVFDKNNLITKTLEKSYMDITIEITEIMNIEQRIASLIIVTGLVIPFSKYGCNIRISVFAERECYWVLSNEFSNQNIELQLSRLRDVLSAINRIQSFPADARRMLKISFEKKSYNGKYIQVLTSNCISPQISDKNLDRKDLRQKIIVFGIKTIFENEINKKYPDIFTKELSIPISEPGKIIEKFFSVEDIQSNSKSFLEDAYFLIDAILVDLVEKSEDKNSCMKKALINQPISLDKNNLDEIIDRLIVFVQKTQLDLKYFSQNIPVNSIKLSEYISYEKKIEKQFMNENDYEELEKLSLRIYENNEVNDNILTISDIYLNRFFKNYLIDNIPTKKVACYSGGSISIPRVIKCLCSGFSDSKIFEKLLGGKKKRYSLLYVLDLSESVLLDCNYSHTIITIIMLLLAPNNLDNVQRILINIIINTKDGIKVLDYNTISDNIKNTSKIEEIIYIIQNELNFSCNPGSCLNTAYLLLQEKKNFNKIFYITDGYINNEFEIRHALSLIYKLFNENIDLIAIGFVLHL